MDELVGHRIPCGRGVETISWVSHVVPLHVSSVRVPPRGAFIGRDTTTRFSPPAELYDAPLQDPPKPRLDPVVVPLQLPERARGGLIHSEGGRPVIVCANAVASKSINHFIFLIYLV